MGQGGYDETKCPSCGLMTDKVWYNDDLRKSVCWTCKERHGETQFQALARKDRERDLHFIEMAKLISTRSKDPSTRTGAVMVDSQGRVVSTGYNGFPKAMADKPELYENRDEKYSRIVHCEMNALIFAKQDLQGCTLYTWPFLSCDRCIVHMIQAGIVRFVAPTVPESLKDRWGTIMERTRGYIRECGLTYSEYKIDTHNDLLALLERRAKGYRDAKEEDRAGVTEDCIQELKESFKS